MMRGFMEGVLQRRAEEHERTLLERAKEQAGVCFYNETPARKPLAGWREQLSAWLAEGLTTKEIAARANVTTERVSQVIRKAPSRKRRNG